MQNLTTIKKSRPIGRQRAMRWLIFTALAVGFVFLIDIPLRYFFFPWSLPLGGQPAMTGRWSGPVALENEVRGTLVLDLHYYQSEDILGSNIDGTATYCLGDQSGEFEVYGEADRQGNIADLRFRPPVDEPIWLLHNASSRWDGDKLTISGVYSYDLTAVHVSRSDVPEPPFTFVLSRGRAEDPPPDCSPTTP